MFLYCGASEWPCSFVNRAEWMTLTVHITTIEFIVGIMAVIACVAVNLYNRIIHTIANITIMAVVYLIEMIAGGHFYQLAPLLMIIFLYFHLWRLFCSSDLVLTRRGRGRGLSRPRRFGWWIAASDGNGGREAAVRAALAGATRAAAAASLLTRLLKCDDPRTEIGALLQGSPSAAVAALLGALQGKASWT